jgi:hypothetical protein
VAKLKYLEMTVANEKLIHEESRSRLNAGIAYYHSVQKLSLPLSSPEG